MRPRILGALALLVAVDAIFLLALRGHPWALQWVRRDADGALYEQAPDEAMRIRVGGWLFDYRAPTDARDAGAVPLPVRRGGDRGLDDMRAAIRWVRVQLRVGEPFARPTWRLQDALRLAADSSRRFLCDSYSRATVAVCQSMGYAARVDLLDGHITSEVYLPALGQWVLGDALYDFIACTPVGEPLSLVETARRLSQSQPVEWMPVVGRRGDDDEMTGRTRANVEGIIRRGNSFVCDGRVIFGPLTLTERVRDLLLGRPRTIQLALQGEPPLDRRERALRWGLLGWNAVGLSGMGLMARRRRPAEGLALASAAAGS